MAQAELEGAREARRELNAQLDHERSSTAAAISAVTVGLGRIAALHYRSSTSYQICYHTRYLYLLKRQCDRTLAGAPGGCAAAAGADGGGGAGGHPRAG